MFPPAPVGHPKDFLLEPKQDSVERGMTFFVGGGGGRQKRCVLFEWKKLQNIYCERVKRHGGQNSGSGVNLKDDLTFAEVDLLCTH